MPDELEPIKRKTVHINKDVDVSTSEPLKYKIVDDRIEQLSHSKAIEFLELNSFAGERAVNDRWVQSLYDEWKRGRFAWDLVIVATARIAGDVLARIYHINGQHTCWMRLQIPVSATARVRWIDYEVESEDMLRRLYGVFDRNKSRSPGHILKALLAGTEETEGIWTKSISRLGSGLRMWLFEDQESYRRNGPHEIALLIQGEHAKLFHTVAHFYQSHVSCTHITRAPVYAAMFATFDKSATKAQEFWEPVATGLGLDKADDARYKLRELLLQTRLESNTGGDNRILAKEDMFRICINAWNKWRKGEPARSTLRTTERRYKPIA